MIIYYVNGVKQNKKFKKKKERFLYKFIFNCYNKIINLI